MHWQRSGELILMVLLGGSGTRHGPIVGAIAYLLLEESLARFTEHWKVILGPLLVVLVLFGRGGIAGILERWRLGELGLGKLGGACATTARTQGERVLRELRQATALVAALAAGALERAIARAKASAAALAARWRRCTVGAGEALLSLVLILDRSISTAIARWRRR
jgi:hypothetical protein